MRERLEHWLRGAVGKGCLLVALIAIGQWTGEWYPLSHFPMYSGFANSTWYVFVTDEAGQPIPVERTFSMRCAYLKKVFISQGGKLRSESRAAEAVLKMLVKRSPTSFQGKALELHRRDIKRNGRRMTTSEKTLGSIDL
jgi:hypothetical protein